MSDETKTDMVKVSAATMSPTGDHTVLAMTTAEGVMVQFALDDMAFCLLGLTFAGALAAVKARKDAGADPTFWERTAEA